MLINTFRRSFGWNKYGQLGRVTHAMGSTDMMSPSSTGMTHAPVADNELHSASHYATDAQTALRDQQTPGMVSGVEDVTQVSVHCGDWCMRLSNAGLGFGWLRG